MKPTLAVFIFLLSLTTATGQPKPAGGPQNTIVLPLSKADLGTFPYFKTFPNFRPLNASDSITLEQNDVYFFDGKKFFTVAGKVSSQQLQVRDDSKPRPSEAQLINEFDKIVTTLGGKKIYTGKLPETQLKSLTSGDDIVSLASKHQVARSAFYGVVEYAIKTSDKEVWIQLQPYSIGSNFYTLLIVEKQNQLLTINTNKQNLILQNLEKSMKATVTMAFIPDSARLLTESKDEILNIIGVFQAHPDWRIKIEVHTAPIGKPAYSLSLTQIRAEAIMQQLISLGVKQSSIEIEAMGDQKPLVSNDTEGGRLTNSRMEITRL